jgi:hypothetical protein
MLMTMIYMVLLNTSRDLRRRLRLVLSTFWQHMLRHLSPQTSHAEAELAMAMVNRVRSNKRR